MYFFFEIKRIPLVFKAIFRLQFLRRVLWVNFDYSFAVKDFSYFVLNYALSID